MRAERVVGLEFSMATVYDIPSLHLYVSALCFVSALVRRLHHSIDEFVFLFLFYPLDCSLNE